MSADLNRPEFAPGHAGIAVCRRIAEAMPDQPIVYRDATNEQVRTPAANYGRPHVLLEATLTTICVSVPPADWATRTWVDYPTPVDPDTIGGDAFYGVVLDAVNAKLRRIAE